MNGHSSTPSRSLRSRIEDDPQGFWRDVVDLHSLVLGWYEDRDLFHKVGYLIAVGRTFEDLVELLEGQGQAHLRSRARRGDPHPSRSHS